MAATRSYLDDLQCSHCGSNLLPKDGSSRGKQTYPFTPYGNRHYYSEQVKEQAIDMHGEGITVAAISRVLAVKPGTVYERGKKSPVGIEDLGLGDHATSAVGHYADHIF